MRRSGGLLFAVGALACTCSAFGMLNGLADRLSPVADAIIDCAAAGSMASVTVTCSTQFTLAWGGRP